MFTRIETYFQEIKLRIITMHGKFAIVEVTITCNVILCNILLAM